MAHITQWFKVVKDGKMLGVVTEQNFAKYSEKSMRIHICNVSEGQYLVLNDRFYRDEWMLPLSSDSFVEYEDAKIVSISEEEYDILSKSELSELDVPSEASFDPEPVYIYAKSPDEAEVVTIDFVRKQKIQELSEECDRVIKNGFSLVLGDGASHHFSMSLEDQINLINLELALDRNEDVIYHADGELAQYFSEEDARSIVSGAHIWSQYNRALFNSLKNWVNNLEDIHEIDAITYKSEIPDEYCTVAFQTLTESL